MEFTWKQLIELIEETFEINQSQLATYLGVNKSTIARLQNGTTHHFSFNNSEIYQKVFDPTNPKSPAHEKNPTVSSQELEHSVLDTMKQIMESRNWIDSAKEINSNEYKGYIIRLIDLVRTNSMLSKKKNAERDEPEKKESIPDDSISSFSSEDRSSEDSPDMEGGPSISIPISYRKCLYCEYFNIAKTIHKYDSGTLGTCTASVKKVNSASPACNNFLENTRKITHDMLMGFSNKFHL